MLSARFHALRKRGAKAVDRQFAEPIRIVFRKDGAPDPARPEVTIDAVLRTSDQLVQAMAGGRGSTWNFEIAEGDAVLSIDMDTYPDVRPLAGDGVQALVRDGQPWFSVKNGDGRAHDRYHAHLTAAGYGS